MGAPTYDEDAANPTVVGRVQHLHAVLTGRKSTKPLMTCVKEMSATMNEDATAIYGKSVCVSAAEVASALGTVKGETKSSLKKVNLAKKALAEDSTTLGGALDAVETALAGTPGRDVASKVEVVPQLLAGPAAKGTGAGTQIQALGAIVDGKENDVTISDDKNLKKKLQDASKLLTGEMASGADEENSVAGAGGYIQQVGDLIKAGGVQPTTDGSLTGKIADVQEKFKLTKDDDAAAYTEGATYRDQSLEDLAAHVLGRLNRFLLGGENRFPDKDYPIDYAITINNVTPTATPHESLEEVLGFLEDLGAGNVIYRTYN